MSAVFYEGAGRFTVGECVPQAPGDGEVRLDVAFCGVCGTDIHIAAGHMDARVGEHRVIGHEMSGVVAELGPGVEGFAPGDRVVVRPLDARSETPADRGHSHVARGLRFLGIDTPGAFQSSWTVPAFTLHHLPEAVDLRLAALVEPLAVACHDVRRGRLSAGETAVVIGGGPIGVLVALVARSTGATTLLAEVSPYRRELAESLGIETLPADPEKLAAEVERRTGGAGADVVFEVSGSAPGAELMTQLAGIRCRIVVVAIFASPTPVRLFDLFWKELEVLGARVYEPEDYERAIGLLAEGSLPLEQLITSVEPLERLPEIFGALAGDPTNMKILVDCRS